MRINRTARSSRSHTRRPVHVSPAAAARVQALAGGVDACPRLRPDTALDRAPLATAHVADLLAADSQGARQPSQPGGPLRSRSPSRRAPGAGLGVEVLAHVRRARRGPGRRPVCRPCRPPPGECPLDDEHGLVADGCDFDHGQTRLCHTCFVDRPHAGHCAQVPKEVLRPRRSSHDQWTLEVSATTKQAVRRPGLPLGP
jgi:hypothetical protein